MNNLLRSKRLLELKDSYSSIPLSLFAQYPNLSDDLSGAVAGVFNSTFVNDSNTRRLFTGYENFYVATANTYPALVSYDTTDDKLTEVSRVYVKQYSGTANTVLSSNPERRYGIVSTYQSIAAPRIPFIKNSFILDVHTYDQNGVFVQNPVLSYDIKQLDPNYYDASISYNGLAGISTDAKYILVTYAVGGPAVGAVTGQKLEIMEISQDGTTLTSRAKIDTPPTEKPGLHSFPQGSIMFLQKNSTTKYNIISAMNSWNLANALGTTSQMSYFVFDSVADTLVLKDTQWVSQYIQGYDVDIANMLAWSVTNSTNTINVSIKQNGYLPYDNPAIDKDYELKAWKINETLGKIVYNGGVSLKQDGIQVRASPNGKVLAITSSPVILTDVYPSTANALSPIAGRYGPCVLKVYRLRKNGSLEECDSSAASPLSFGLAWSEDSATLAVSGQTVYRTVTVQTPFGASTRTAGIKSDQLYNVIDNDE